MIFGLSILAAWRLTYMLHQEDGPFNVFARLRDLIFKEYDEELPNQVQKLWSCYYCLSVWVSIPFAVYLAISPATFIIALLGVSGGAIIINDVHGRLTNG